MKWDADDLSKHFKHRAESAAAHALAIAPKLEQQPTYQVRYDQH